MEITLDILLFFFCIIVIIESLYDRYNENRYNQHMETQLQRILNNLNYIVRYR